MDFYKCIEEQGFNRHTAMDIGCILALAWLEKSEKEAITDNNAVDAIEQYCKDHSISNKFKKDFLMEVNEYSLK